ncbi:MAG: hypothetical protein DME32_08470 [Verrucomicrobia bacterium]|nr:MAG: hypothetical protein DME32_08470 [Verrucomicrobiota bacterium]
MARRGLQSEMSPIQAEVERRGMQIFDLVDRHPESIFSKAGFYQRMMEFSMRDEHFKVQMFRFVDVLASLRRGSDIVQHLDEYFADMRNGYAPLIRTGVSLARIVPIISGKFLRWNVSGMARQFIAGRNPEDVMKTLRKKRRQGIGFTVDLLGEAVVSEEEATEYTRRCQELLEHLARETRGWTDPVGKNPELFPVVNVSVKISALYSQMNPAQKRDARTLSHAFHRAGVSRLAARRHCDSGLPARCRNRSARFDCMGTSAWHAIYRSSRQRRLLGLRENQIDAERLDHPGLAAKAGERRKF